MKQELPYTHPEAFFSKWASHFKDPLKDKAYKFLTKSQKI